ncbi:hypothetical protein D9757_006571 [Collybiopsis confluens]|uniref:Uncharacterized protein n=1 Tax=Collybiopsis confluens TaxID=2823264 RepID=A0A8H5HQF9_9AGAR|nr:hypothetical protein D9757_006571 [Collybiopsis confluens]
MPSSTPFPAEIYDSIIDELASSKDTLSACSLVHSSWAPRSRTHMFRNIAFKVEAPERNHPPLDSRTTAFQQHVASNRTVASYARSLVLTLTDKENIATQIPQASHLHNLLSLTLKCSHLTIHSANDSVLTRLLSFIRHNSHLEHISLQSVIIDPSGFEVFLACIAIRTREIQSLYLHDIWAPDWINDAWGRWRARRTEFNTNYRSRSLARLCISYCEDGVIPALIRTFDVYRLEKLALLSLGWDSCTTMLSATLQAESLAHLTIEISENRQISSHDTREDHVFYRLTSIPTLQLMLRKFQDAPTVLHKLYRSALQRPPRLQKLHLQFRRYPSGFDTNLDRALNELFSLMPFLRVSIGFDIQEGSIRSTCSAGGIISSPGEISALFPLMNQRGSLRFRSLDSWWTSAESRKSD